MGVGVGGGVGVGVGVGGGVGVGVGAGVGVGVGTGVGVGVGGGVGVGVGGGVGVGVTMVTASFSDGTQSRSAGLIGNAVGAAALNWLRIETVFVIGCCVMR